MGGGGPDRPGQFEDGRALPNARRSTIHIGRLTAAREQARQLDHQCRHRPDRIPPLQRQAIRTHLAELDTHIADIQPAGTP